MSAIEIAERPIEAPETETSSGSMPPPYGKCPVCNKPLYPKDKHTGEPKAPVINAGYDSRARCGGCGTVLRYIGDGQWHVLKDKDLSDDDRMADRLGME